MATVIEVRKLVVGWEWSVSFGVTRFQDENGDTGLTPPTRIVSGFAKSKREAKAKAGEFVDEL